MQSLIQGNLRAWKVPCTKRVICHFTAEGEEKSTDSKNFQIMRMKKIPSEYSNLKWVRKDEEDGSIPVGVVEGRITSEGERIYVIRCRVENDQGTFMYVCTLEGSPFGHRR